MSRTRKVLLLVALPLVIIFLLIATRLVMGPKNQGGTNQARKVTNCQKNTNPVFSANFVELAKIKQIGPIGGVMVGSPARSYIFVNGAETNARQTATLYAPTDAVLEGIVFARRDPSNPNAPGEYRLDFRASCEVTFHFDHLDDVSPAIKALAPATPAATTKEAKPTNLTVKASETVGFSNGTNEAGSFDFYLLNQDKKAAHVNPERWTWEQTTIADCPYDYFAATLKAQYYSLFRSQDGSAATDCGSPSHDIAGTASGGWFQGADTDMSGQWLEIANVNGRTEILLRAAGSHQFSIRDYRAKILPDALKVGASQCYSEPGKWAFVRVDADSQLSLSRGAGSCPAAFPNANVETWQR